MPRSAAATSAAAAGVKGLGLAALITVGFACAGPAPSEAEPVAPPAEPSTRVAPSAPPASPTEDRPSPVEPATQSPAPPEVADSSLPGTKRVVDKSVQPGLVEFAAQLPKKGLLWVGRLEGNGGRDVVVFVPDGAHNDRDFELVYHFHGTYSEHVEAKRPGVPKKKWVGWNRLQQTIDAAAELQGKRDYNVALVYPFSAGKRREPGLKGWWNKAYDRMWMDPAKPPEYRDSFDKLHAEVVELLGREFGVHPTRLRRPAIAEGHSAGGIALRNIAVKGTSHVGEYIFQDAGFQGWADQCFEAARRAPGKPLVTLVITNKGIADPFGKRDPWCTRLEESSALWDKHGSWCRSRSGESPRGSDATCAELKADDEEWDDYEDWCAGMKDDMKSVPGIYVHRTSIYHGDQPRHFTGGLELSSNRFDQPE